MWWRLLLILSLTMISITSGGQYDDPQTLDNRKTMVHLFEWRWKDVAAECENFLQYFGYGAVQVSPPQEHIVLEKNGDRPWWIRYQPVSYKLFSRSGTRDEFIDMVQRCNKVGVRIVVDAVINHMVGIGQSYNVGGISDSMNTEFRGVDKAEYFPDVPFSASDFHDSICDHDINNWGDAFEVRNCRLVGLLDLDQGKSNVQQKISGYFNDMVNIGIAGVRVDAAKSILPSQLGTIYGMTKNLRSDVFGSNKRPFIAQETPYGGAVTPSEYVGIGRVTNFGYGNKVAAAVKRSGGNFKYFSSFGPTWFDLADTDALNFIDNHDSQRHGIPLTYKDGSKYIMAVCFMLAWDYGYPRVMSSYYFSNSDQGPPSSGSPNFKTQGPTFNNDLTCNSKSGWVCEHRWIPIRNMAKFRSAVAGTQVSNIVTIDNGIAFSRGSKGFFAINNGYSTWYAEFQTGMPLGVYCNVINGLNGNNCVGNAVYVKSNGQAHIEIPAGSMVAIYTDSNNPTQPPPPPTPPTFGPTKVPISTQTGSYSSTQFPTPSTINPPGQLKTVIFIEKSTSVGQDIFLRGGIGLESSWGKPKHCSNSNYDLDGNPCALKIQHLTQVPNSFQTYLDWEKGDKHLDWYGPEPGQGTYNGEVAQGTPMAWSTNDPNTVGYQSLNHWGPNYWIVVLNMDCSTTDKGWFEFKGYELGGDGWEKDINQNSCSGTIGGNKPYPSRNHMGRCGYVNVFHWNDNSCMINSL